MARRSKKKNKRGKIFITLIFLSLAAFIGGYILALIDIGI